MAEEFDQLDEQADLDVGEGVVGAGVAGNQPTTWSQVWQLPALLLAIGLFIIALSLALPRRQPNDFPGALQKIENSLAADQLDEATHQLNEIEPFLGEASAREFAQFKVLTGDLIYKRLLESGSKNLDEYKLVRRLYREAREIGLDLDEAHRQRLAEVLVALGEDAQALRELESLADAPAQRRYTVIKQIVQRRRKIGDRPQSLLELADLFLDELKLEPDKVRRRSEEIWALSLRMQGLLEAGDPDEVITQLLRHVLRLKDGGGDDDLAPLQVLLAQAYYSKGEYTQADVQFRSAQQKLDNNDSLNAEVLVGQARIVLDAQRDYQKALDLFTQAVRQYPGSPVYFEALVGQGLCEANLGNDPEAIDRFSEAIRLLHEEPSRSQDRVAELAAIVRSQHSLHDDRQNDELALQYLSLTERLFPAGIDAQDALTFAMTHAQLAQRLLEQAKAKQSDAARHEANRAAWKHLNQAAEYYQRHAHDVARIEPAAARNSLWAAAAAYDQADEWEKAVVLYREYIQAGDDDPRQVEAMARLGLALMAQGQFQAALERFVELDRYHPKSQVTHEVLVPMARCHWQLGDTDLAKSILSRVITDNEQIRPESDVYRDALVELGLMHYKLGEYERAIMRLDEAAKRYGGGKDGMAIQFALADAYRQSVPQLQKEAAQPVSQSTRVELINERTARLEIAQKLFEQVVVLLKDRPRAVMTDLEFVQYRNAWFYRADCAFDLGRYEQAISLYDEAANKWSDQPSSLLALVQIVNANCELGKIQDAKIANQRAREQLKRIPEEAFKDQSLPMTREHWQDWLRWTDELDLFDGKQRAGGEGTPAAPDASS